MLIRATMLCIFSVLSVGGFSRVDAQTGPPGESKLLDPVTPQTEAFIVANDKLREHVKRMRETVVRFHVSDSVAADKEYREQLRELCMAGSQLNKEWTAAALDEYRLAPADRKELADMLFRLLERNVEMDLYDQMLELAQTLVDTGYEHPDLDRFMAMTAFASHDFATFKQYASKLIEQGRELSDEYKMIYLNIDQVDEAWKSELAAREADAAGEPLPRVMIRTTKGDIEVELFENQAPNTVANFISLAEQGFYRNSSFFRVIKHFMAQTGCPNGDGTGGPGHYISNEATRPDFRMFFTGTLGVALSKHPDTGGSQFFITLMPTPQLNQSFTAFGRIIAGFDALAAINRLDPEKKEEGAPPVIPDEIIDIEVLYKRDHSYVPTKLDPKQVQASMSANEHAHDH